MDIKGRCIIQRGLRLPIHPVTFQIPIKIIPSNPAQENHRIHLPHLVQFPPNSDKNPNPNPLNNSVNKLEILQPNTNNLIKTHIIKINKL